METFYFRFFIGLILTSVFALIDPIREYDFGQDVTLISIDHASGDIYVSGTSCIYHLDRNFSRLEQTCLGVGSGASIANQDTNVLEIDNTFHCLLVCTSAGGGQCELLSLRNITKRLPILSNDSKGSKVEVSENYRSIVHFLSKNNTSHVVVASPNDFTIQTFQRPSQMSKPILSVRAISVIRDEFQMTYKTSLGPHSDFLQINKRKNSFYYDFINGFCYNDTCFYLTLQQENLNNKTLVNRIARIHSSSLFPYIDIPVGVYTYKQQTYNRVVAMTLGKVDTGKNNETPVLVFVYGVAADVTSKDIDVASGYAIRVTPLEKLTEVIETVIMLCRNQAPFVKLPDWYYNVSSDCTQIQWSVSQPRVMQGTRWDPIWSASLVIPGNASEMSNVTSVFTHTQPLVSGDPQRKLPEDMTIYVTMSSGRIYYFYCGWLTSSHAIIQFINFTLLDGGGTHIKRPVVQSDGVTSEEDYYILYGSKVLRRPLDYCQNGGISTCSECTQIPGCVWCPKTKQCLLKAKCPDEGCPVTIDSFEPGSGPWNGGTRITLRGSALSGEDISVKICGENCSSPVYFQSGVMSCTVPPSTNNWTECAINVSSKNHVTWTSLMDNEKPFFTYTIPKVWKMEPNRMLKSEQSFITFRGEHLNTGSDVSIFFDSDIFCQIHHRRQDSMECQLKLSPKLESEHFLKEKKYKVNITIDNYTLLTSDLDSFSLYPEPNITGIYPNWTFHGGGLPLTVYGSNLHFMQSPLLEVSLPSDTERLIQQSNCQPCSDVNNSTCLRCCTSNVTTYISPTYHQTASVSFRFISVSNRSVIYNMSKDRQLLTLVPDPSFTLGVQPISGCILSDDQSPLILTGQNIFSPTILKVFVNETPCPVLNATLNSLTCDLKRTLQNKTSKNLRTTILQVNIETQICERKIPVGCIVIVETINNNSESVVLSQVVVLILVVVLMMTLVVLGYAVYARHQKKKIRHLMRDKQNLSADVTLNPSLPDVGSYLPEQARMPGEVLFDEHRESTVYYSIIEDDVIPEAPRTLTLSTDASLPLTEEGHFYNNDPYQNIPSNLPITEHDSNYERPQRSERADYIFLKGEI